MPSVQTMNVGKHDDVSSGWPVGQCVCDVCRRAVLSSTNTPAKLLPSKLLFPPTLATHRHQAQHCETPSSTQYLRTWLTGLFAHCSLLTKTNVTKIAPFAHFQSQSMTGSVQNSFKHDRRKFQSSGFSRMTEWKLKLFLYLPNLLIKSWFNICHSHKEIHSHIVSIIKTRHL